MHALKLPVGRLDATVAVFSPKDAEYSGLTNWSLKHLQRQEDALHHPFLIEKLSEKFDELNIHNAFAPHVAAASGQIVNATDLTNRIRLKKSNLYRNSCLPADGIFLDKGEAFVMSSSGCPVVLASAGDDFITAHAGRDCLIDRGAVVNRPTRKHISVVDAIIEKLGRRGAIPSDIVMIMLFAIPAKEFTHNANHPQYGPFNRALAFFVDARWPGGIYQKGNETFLDIEKVFIEQARQNGVRRCWAGHSLSRYPTLSHTRDGKDIERRNLVIVKRNA